MATHAGNLFRDQNLNVHFNGASIGGKSNASNAPKKGGLGGRKALNDISNSGKPSMFQASKKHNLKNVISFEEDIGVSKPIFSVVGKTNASKVAERKQAGGRKALGDLTNSVKPHHEHKAPKKTQNKLSAVAEENILPSAIADEQFLHNHQECIKAQRKAVDMDSFLKTIGLDFSMQSDSTPGLPLSTKMKPESPPRNLEMMEEMSELLIEDRSFRSPYGSPKSPKSCFVLEEDYNNFPSFILMQSP